LRDSKGNPVNGASKDARPNEVDPFFTELKLAPVPSAVASARRFTELFLRKQDLDEIIDDAQLITSELVTNAIKATGITATQADYASPDDRPVIARLRVSLPVLRIEVWDRDTRPPVPALPDLLDESGRGLMLVVAIAAAWGHQPSAGGKITWAEIRIPPKAGRLGYEQVVMGASSCWTYPDVVPVCRLWKVQSQERRNDTDPIIPAWR
jgi:anti-sigma regulatory factor (Ser/Thr protein kinase)